MSRLFYILMKVFDEQNKRGEIFRFISLVFPLNLAATVVAIAFDVSTQRLKDPFSLENIATSFTYSNCIGTLICLVFIYFSSRWTENSVIVRLLKVIITIFAGTFLGVVAARFILSLIFPYLKSRSLIPSWRTFVFSLGIAFTFGFAVYFYEILQAKIRQKELDEEKAKTLATEAQLASLESRIHPHFLFNTLNSIAALIREEPERAEKTVEKLSALLRYSLDEHSKGLVSLKQELEITEKYLEIEKIRFEERLDYKIEAAEKFSNIQLPPLALQTLVENSIKHVAAKTAGNTKIIVSVKENGANVIIEVSDSGSGFSESSVQEGHGLDLLEKRLNAIFQGEAGLEIVAKKAGCVKLKVPKER